jgi:hypothetical protein
MPLHSLPVAAHIGSRPRVYSQSFACGLLLLQPFIRDREISFQLMLMRTPRVAVASTLSQNPSPPTATTEQVEQPAVFEEYVGDGSQFDAIMNPSEEFEGC